MSYGRPERNDRLVVSTADLADLLEPFFANLQATYDTRFIGRERSNKGAGAFSTFATDVARSTGVDEGNVPRRIWSLRTRETISTGIDLADAFLLAADQHLARTDLAVFPDNYETAKQMVVDRYGLKRPRPLARKLLRFAKAYLEATASEETRERIHAEVLKRQARHRGISVDELLAGRAADEARETELEEVAA